MYYRGRDKTESFQTERVERSDITEVVSVTGELVPNIYADLAFTATGMVEEIFVKEGDTVKAEQPIASLDGAVLQSQLNEARIAQAIAEQNEKLARRGWDTLKEEERNTKKLASEQARENVQTILAQIKGKKIFSPIDGRIARLDIRTGETVTAGVTVARVIQDDHFVIEARVPESDIAKIMIGMSAQVTFDAFSSDEVFTGTVVEIDQSSTVVQDVVLYNVKFHLEKGDDRLKDGMTANLDIETARRDDVLTVPFRVITKEGNKTYVEVQEGENEFVKREVITGLEGDENRVEILSGLQEGERVILSIPKK